MITERSAFLLVWYSIEALILLPFLLPYRDAFLYIQALQRINKSKGLQKPDDNSNYDNDVENVFDFSIHGDVGIHQPEDNTNNNQYK
jgi:hypothetical protein